MSARSVGHLGRPAPAQTASDPRSWIPVVCAVALIGSLFLPWYGLAISTVGTPLPLDLASTAWQWMTVTPWIVMFVALAVVIYATAGSSRSRRHRALTALPRELVLIGPSVAVMLILFRLVQPPSLPGSSLDYNLQGTSEAGPFIALFLALAMTASVYAQARRRSAT